MVNIWFLSTFFYLHIIEQSFLGNVHPESIPDWHMFIRHVEFLSIELLILANKGYENDCSSLHIHYLFEVGQLLYLVHGTLIGSGHTQRHSYPKSEFIIFTPEMQIEEWQLHLSDHKINLHYINTYYWALDWDFTTYGFF